MKAEATVNNEKQVVTVFPTREAHTMPEFAALFGREVTWAYRMKYAGKIKVIPSSAFLGGGDMVPQSEVERLRSQATTYTDEIAGKAVPRKKPKVITTSKRKGKQP